MRTIRRPTEQGGDPAAVDASFELRLIEATRPISEHFLAVALHHLFETGLYDRLLERQPLEGLADDLDMDRRRLGGFLRYLANEGIVELGPPGASLTEKGRRYGQFRPWYTLLIGGYAATAQQIGGALKRGTPDCSRDGRLVGVGSCEMSRYDGIPMTLELLARTRADCRQVLDLGCGNGLYLIELCRVLPEVTAWGVEPDKAAYDEARELVGRAGAGDRVHLVNSSATEFLLDPPGGCEPDLVVFGYVLQEILAQEGEDALLSLLTEVVASFPRINVVVIEVADEHDNPRVMRHGLALNFWNPYFLIHHFTRQRLETRAWWEELFARAGLRVESFVTTDPRVDSTGLELGYLLRGGGRKAAGGGTGAGAC